MKHNKCRQGILAGLMSLCLLAGCGGGSHLDDTESMGYIDQQAVENVIIEDEAVALSNAPAALPDTVAHSVEMKDVEASGTLEKKNDKAVIDYSNTTDGYVMIRFTAETTQKLKAQVKGPTITYTYNVTPGQWTVLPLSDGNGQYKVSVYENVTGTKYAAVISQTMDVAMKDAFAPFIRPNQYVDYTSSSAIVFKAKELTKNTDDALSKVGVVYDFVVKNLTYDTERAKTVQSGYLPVLDQVLEEKKGICFDYAALMTGMLRSQGIPCKLVVGYAGEVYHAWINVWTEENGWIDGVIFFNGKSWQRMDPTFASSGNQSKAIMKYIGDGSNYTAKYFY